MSQSNPIIGKSREKKKLLQALPAKVQGQQHSLPAAKHHNEPYACSRCRVLFCVSAAKYCIAVDTGQTSTVLTRISNFKSSSISNMVCTYVQTFFYFYFSLCCHLCLKSLPLNWVINTNHGLKSRQRSVKEETGNPALFC